MLILANTDIPNQFLVMISSPKNLFKYVHPDRIDILEKLQIRFTQPSRFNDPFEVLPSIDGFDVKRIETAEEQVHRNLFGEYKRKGGELSFEEFRRIQAAHNRKAIDALKDPQIFKERAIARELRHWDKHIGILSVSATEKNLLMWAHYTKSHEGMVIEFDPKHPFFSPSGKSPDVDFGILTEVIYSKVRPRIISGKPTTVDDLKMLRTKSDEWEYEQEWRVFQLLEKSDEKIPRGNETVHLFKLPPKAIKRVIIGCRMEDVATRLRIINAIKMNPELKHVQIHEAVRELDEFGLKYVPLRYDL